MVNETRIREHLASYIANRESFAMFHRWLVDHSWDMDEDSSVEAQDLVNDLNESIFDYVDGYLSEEELRTRLASSLKSNA